MTFFETKLWSGLGEDVMQEVNAKIGAGFFKSKVAHTDSREKKETTQGTGVIKHYNSEKGFGFIGVKGEDDLFFHFSEVASSTLYLSAGDHVTYEIGTKRDGKPCATNITII